ncbi:MAG: serpin family protein [Clostridia bacterium]|nr:serpin family protein [Clostridia bacterium]
MKTLFKRLAAAVIAALTLISLFGCLKGGGSVPAGSGENTDVFTPSPAVPGALAAPTDGNVTDFALKLFRASAGDGENALLSPLSVLYALAMTANGAKGQTLSEMENVLGMEIDKLNTYLGERMKTLPRGDKYKLDAANSIWFKEDENFSVKEDFLKVNEDHYAAEVRSAPFDDGTLNDINNWVKEKTDGMIEKMLDKIDPNSVMFLINALAFDAEWEEKYVDGDVRESIFILEDGTYKKATFMYSVEGEYLEDEKAEGFIKYYAGRKYAFVGLLPKDGVKLADYVASLDGNKLNEMLSSPSHEKVKVSVPKFETEYDAELSRVLARMGMPTAFDGDHADFSGIGTYRDGNLYIGAVLHKTFISVDEKGTKAGAATVVDTMTFTSIQPEMKRVYLNRPFVYMLIDCENNLPFFIGTMYDVEK